MALVPDQKFSTFQNGGTPTTGDIIVGLRGGINTKFNWVLPSTVDTITGTADQVLVNASSGVPVSGDVTLTTPQNIAPTSSPTFANLTLTNPLTGANGGTGFANTGLTINLSSGAVNYVLTSDSSGNATWQAQGYLTGAVLLSPSGNQTILNGYDLIVSAGGNLQASSGNLVGGSSGFAGNVILFPPTAASGLLEIHASDSAAMYTGLLTNTSLSAGRTWSLPDATGTISLDDQVQRSLFNFAASTGVNDAFVVTLTPAPAALTDGLLVTMYSGTLSNATSAATLNVNGLGAKPIVTFAGALAPEDIETGSNYLFIYNAADDNFQLLNPFITTADTFLVQQNAYNYAIDTGIVNAYIADILPNNASVIDGGMPIVMQAAHNNTAASTLTVNGITKSIATSAGSALVGGEILANQVCYFLYNNSSDKFILINSTVAVNSVTGTANQVLVNGTSGTAQFGAVTLTTPQDIATASSPTFAALTLTAALTVANGGSGRNTATAYALIAGGTTATGVHQSLSTGTAGQLLQSGGASALPSWTTATFPSGSGTLNHMLRSDGTNWVQTTAMTVDASDNLAGLTSVTTSGLITSTAGNITAPLGFLASGSAAGGVIGQIDLYPTTAAKGAFIIFATPNTGNTNFTITNAAMGQATAITFPDPGAATATVAYTSGSGAMTYVSVAGTTQAALGGRAYVLNNAGATTVTLPTSGSSTIGDTIKIKGRSAAAWIIQANTSQVIKFGSVSSSAAGTATSAAGSDSIQLVYVAANEWSVDWAVSSLITLA